MTPDEYAEVYAYDLHLYGLMGERAELRNQGHIGASDFSCRQRMTFILNRVPPSDAPSKWKAFVGQALDERVKAARLAAHPHLIVDAKLSFTFPQLGYTIGVSPDEIDPDEPSVTDGKCKDGLQLIRRQPSDDQQRMQRHLQGAAAIAAGLVPEEGLIVRNAYVDRSGDDDTVHVEQEPFSWDIVTQAEEFLSDALYAAKHNEDAWRDKPFYFCESFCEWFTRCRGGLVQTEVVHDDTLASLAALHEDAKGEKSIGGKLYEETKKALRGVRQATVVGEAGTFRVWWTTVNDPRGAYEKLFTRRVA